QQTISGTSIVQELHYPPLIKLAEKNTYADIIHLNDWIDEVNAVRTYKFKCYQAGNPQAIYLRGMEKICLAGEKRFLLAKYVDGMLNLAFSVDDRGMVHNFTTLTREFSDQMDHMIATEMDQEHGEDAIVVYGNVQFGTSAMIFIWPLLSGQS
ncbi:unnamed protein product, partial [Eruca vesicaria subsp. sativa]|nr:unnamed protein product [Eruca vesicaria subsp. sativa]